MNRPWMTGLAAVAAILWVGCGSEAEVFVDGPGGPMDGVGEDGEQAGFELGADAEAEFDGDDVDPSPGAGAGEQGQPTDPAEAVCWYEFGNPTCRDVRLGSELLRIEPVEPGEYAVGDGAIWLGMSTDGTAVSFESTVPIDGIIVKAGAGALVCRYPQSTHEDIELVAQVDEIPEQVHAASHVLFCDLVFSKAGDPQ